MNRPQYFQLPSAQPEKLAEFYARLFDWEFGPLGIIPDVWVLITGPFEQPGLQGMVMGKFMEATVNVIGVDDIDSVLAKVTAQGGRITTPKQQIPSMGDFAWCKDPSDNYFVLMQADQRLRSVLLNAVSARIPGSSGRPVHFEIPADDMPALEGFYSAVLDWQMQAWDGMGPYTFAITGPEPVNGIDGAIQPRSAAEPHPLNVIEVFDIHSCIAKAVSLGATLLIEPHPIPGVGVYAKLGDLDGNQFGIIRMREEDKGA